MAVSVGPGSFTGLRVGVVCAKTLAYANGCQLAAVDTLEAIAANSPADVVSVHVIADAQRGDLFVADYCRKSIVEWDRDRPPRIVAGRRVVPFVDRSRRRFRTGASALRAGRPNGVAEPAGNGLGAVSPSGRTDRCTPDSTGIHGGCGSTRTALRPAECGRREGGSRSAAACPISRDPMARR